MSMLTIILSIVILLLLMYAILIIISLKLMTSFIQWKYIKLMNGNKDFASKKFQSDFEIFTNTTNGRELIKNKFKDVE